MPLTRFSSRIVTASILLLAFSLTPAGCTQKGPQDETKTDTPKAPGAFCEQTSYSFGKVQRGDDVRHSFIIKNNGKAQLKLLGTRSSCPCVMPQLTGTDIAPGQEGKLTLRLNTSRQKGILKHKVTLKTNDPKHPSVVFELEGEVEVLAAFEPDVVSFGDILKGSTKSAELHLVGTKTKQMKPGELVSSDPDQIQAEFAKNGADKFVKVTIKAPNKEGRLAGLIRLSTGLENPKEIRARVMARVSSDLVTDRSYALFSMKQQGVDKEEFKSKDQPVYLVHVRSLSNKAFKITEISDPLGIVTGQAEPVKNGWKIELKLAKKPSQKRGDILIHTDRKDQPVLSVKYIIRSGQASENSIRPRLKTRAGFKKPMMRVSPKDSPGPGNKSRIKLDQAVRHQPGKIRRLEPNGPKKYPLPATKSDLNSGTKSK